MTGTSPAPEQTTTATPGNPGRSTAGTGARVTEQGNRVVLEFPAISGARRDGLAAALVREAFTHPAVRADRPIVVCVPRGDSDVLAEVRPHLEAPRTRVAGVTCLVEGRVRAIPTQRAR